MSSFLDRLSARERRLAVLTVSLLAAGVVVFSGVQMLRGIEELSGNIERLERELLALAQQDAQRAVIDAEYGRVVEENSSGMTREEIHDSLRREIFRLARIRMPGKDGGPAREVTLVKIPTLREGQLSDIGDGVREYRIQVRIPVAQLNNLVRFVANIEKTQVLRVDSLELMRAPDAKKVQAVLEITRTVLDIDAASVARGRD